MAAYDTPSSSLAVELLRLSQVYRSITNWTKLQLIEETFSRVQPEKVATSMARNCEHQIFSSHLSTLIFLGS